jgi:hypothetical protein
MIQTLVFRTELNELIWLYKITFITSTGIDVYCDGLHKAASEITIELAEIMFLRI